MEAFSHILELAEFPPEATEYLTQAFASIADHPQFLADLQTAADGLFTAADTRLLRRELAQKVNLHRYTVNLLVLLYAHIRLEQVYREKGLSPTLFSETLSDLRFKLQECWDIHGIWGNFVFFWYPGFFDLTRFKLGRMQYEPYPGEKDLSPLVGTDAPILKCHIPASGPLTPESALDSLEQAYRFFGYTGPMPVYCGSWLLYPPQYTLYPQGSNLQKFYDLFTIFSQKPQPDNPNCWRVFGTMDPNPAAWPLDTRFRRAVHSFLTAGNSMGFGEGLLLYSPEKGVWKKENGHG